MANCVPGFDLSEEPAATPPRAVKPKLNDAVTLRGVRVELNSPVGSAFVSDCARNRERIFSDDQIREKYEIDPNDWDDIVKNKPLRLAINAECERRTFNGDASREAAAKEFTKAPAALGKILNDPKSSPRHVVEASKELRATAHSGDEKSRDDFDRVVVTINLGGDQKLVVDSGPLPNRTKDTIDAE